MKWNHRIFFFFVAPAETWIRFCGWLFNVGIKTEMKDEIKENK